MVAEKAQPDDRESQLDEVIASYLEALEAGAAPDRRSWLQRYPHLADELAAFFADEAGFDGLVGPLKVPTPTPHSGLTPTGGSRGRAALKVDPAPVAPGRELGDYELLEEAARGGMGVVYRARQRSLNRVVALKVIRDADWATPQDVQRFRLEAEAVAQLDHPNIVPVYEVGEWRAAPDSPPVHYFSMKWIDGGTLAQLLAGESWSAADKEGQRAAARLLAETARAVHYAHQRGILHRDLKPANVLLEAHGLPPAGSSDPPPTPMITDFGLAKRVAADDRLTQTGVAVGTPSYMAPEQASPGKGQGGTGSTTAADVYSLGAILYELLTGRPPFRGLTMLDTLRDVLEREPQRPRALNPRLDRDLETICLKCLRKDPTKRYASASALADDLERFLAGEPIHARPVGKGERLWRWCRRNPILAVTSFLAAAAVLAALALFALVAIKESHHAARLADKSFEVQMALSETRIKQQAAELSKKEAERQRAEADRQRKEAEHQRGVAVANLKEAELQRQLEERSFRQAHKAVNDFYTRLADELQRAPGLQPLRKKLLEAGLGYYQNFLKQRKDDPKLRRELADAQYDVARISGEIGSRVESEKAYRAALAVYEGLLKDAPADVNLRLCSARTCFNLALLLSLTGKSKESLDLHRRVQDYYDGLLRDAPRHPNVLSGFASIQTAMGELHRQAGRLAEGHDAFRQAVAIREKLAQAQPRDAGQQDALALAYNNLGVMQMSLGRTGEALASFRRALAIRERRAQELPRSPGLQLALAASCRDIGITLRDHGQRQDALKMLEKARALRTRVVQENPSLIQAQTDLASSHLDVGGMLRDAKKYPEAMGCFEQARAILERLVQIDPVSPYLRRDLAHAHVTVGNLHQAQSETAGALQAFEKARALQEKLVVDEPDVPVYQSRLAGTLNNMGLAFLRQKRPDEARRLLHKAVAHQKLAIARAPQVVSFRRHLAGHYGLLTEIELTAGRLPEGVAAALERQKLWPGDAKVQYAVATDLAFATGLVGKGKASLSAEEKAQRNRYADLAMAALRQALAAGFRDRQRIERTRDLDSLRGREDFQKLLAGLGEGSRQ
jgi:serine/threonine protein kinase